MKIVTVVGTRPEFIQISPLTQAFAQSDHNEVIINTGQHYDDNMSQIFFKELYLPKPHINLEVGSGSHASQTGQMMIRLGETIKSENPDCVVVYGDTNSTVAGAIVASKAHIPLIHVEAGLRSFDRQMPEEVNRVITDHISNILFAPTDKAVHNLSHEGIITGVFKVGDVRVDILANLDRAIQQRMPNIQQRLNLLQEYVLATIHRAENTDNYDRLRGIISIFESIDMTIILPIHPRLRKIMKEQHLKFSSNVVIIDPVGFLDMMALLNLSKVLLTDSGGLQKEAYLLKRPTITLRDSTEWLETVEAGWNYLCAPNINDFNKIFDKIINNPPSEHPDFYGAYGVGQRMADIIIDSVT